MGSEEVSIKVELVGGSEKLPPLQSNFGSIEKHHTLIVNVPPIGVEFLYTYKTLAPLISHIERWVGFFIVNLKKLLQYPNCEKFMFNQCIHNFEYLKYLYFFIETNIINYNTYIIYLSYLNIVFFSGMLV